MAFTVVQAGSSLQMVKDDGTVATLTLPTGITLKTTEVPRFAVYGRYVVVVNTPNRPIAVDALGVVRPLVPNPPSNAISLSGVTAGALTGDYKARQTFVFRDAYGNIIAESDFSPLMSSAVTVSGKTLKATSLNIAKDDVSGSIIYRTLDGGDVYFKWRELDGNVQTTSDEDDLADLALDIFTAPTLGSVPDLFLVAEWRGRLFGVSRTNLDVLRYTEPGTMYAWATGNEISVPRIGTDTRGVTGIIARRESFVVGRQNSLKELVGTSNDDFRFVDLSDKVGIEASDSIVVWDDIAYWLAKDGVYKLGANGVESLTAGRVSKWFTTSTYFNRSRFKYARGGIDPVRKKYVLQLSATGSSDLDRWIEYDIETGKWWGPHKTSAFTPTSVVQLGDSDDTQFRVFGSADGYLWKDQTTATDGTSSGIDLDLITGWENFGDPKEEKYIGELTVLGKVQTTGTVAVTPTVGDASASAKNAVYWVLSAIKGLIGRMGKGKMLKLRFTHATAGEPVELYGLEIDNVHTLGER